LGEVRRVSQSSCVRVDASNCRERAALWFHVIDPHEVAQLAFVIRDAGARQRLERSDESRTRAPRSLRHPSLLAAVPREEHDDPVRLTELVRAQDQRIGGVNRHGMTIYSTLSPAGASGTTCRARGTTRTRTRR